jgi:DnaJ-domain-containing protein 1
MSEAIIVAIIAGACAVLGQWLITRQQTAKRRIDEAVRDAKLDDRLAGVEKRLDEHNRYAEKFASIQTDIAVIKNDIKTLYKEGK